MITKDKIKLKGKITFLKLLMRRQKEILYLNLQLKRYLISSSIAQLLKNYIIS